MMVFDVSYAFKCQHYVYIRIQTGELFEEIAITSVTCI